MTDTVDTTQTPETDGDLKLVPPVMEQPTFTDTGTTVPSGSSSLAQQTVFNTTTLVMVPPAGSMLNGSGILNITDHGIWSTKSSEYIHDGSTTEAPLVPEGTMFCYRESDKTDWYEYSRQFHAFAYGSVLATCLYDGRGWIIQGVFFDKRTIFPAGMRLIEIQNYKGPVDKVHKQFEGQYYYPDIGNIGPTTITTTDLKLYAASAKKTIEEGGISINGYRVATDRGSQAMITQTVVGIGLLPDVKIDWKGPDGISTTLSADFIRLMATFVLTHVSNTFSALSELNVKLDSHAITTYAGIDRFLAQRINTAYTATA